MTRLLSLMKVSSEKRKKLTRIETVINFSSEGKRERERGRKQACGEEKVVLTMRIVILY